MLRALAMRAAIEIGLGLGPRLANRYGRMRMEMKMQMEIVCDGMVWDGIGWDWPIKMYLHVH